MCQAICYEWGYNTDHDSDLFTYSIYSLVDDRGT